MKILKQITDLVVVLYNNYKFPVGVYYSRVDFTNEPKIYMNIDEVIKKYESYVNIELVNTYMEELGIYFPSIVVKNEDNEIYPLEGCLNVGVITLDSNDISYYEYRKYIEQVMAYGGIYIEDKWKYNYKDLAFCANNKISIQMPFGFVEEIEIKLNSATFNSSNMEVIPVKEVEERHYPSLKDMERIIDIIDEEIDITKGNLVIPRESLVDMDLTLHFMNVMSIGIGVPVSKSSVKELEVKISDEKYNIMHKVLIPRLLPSNDYIDITGRTATNNHIGVLFVKYCNNIIKNIINPWTLYRSIGGTISFKKEFLSNKISEWYKLISDINCVYNVENLKLCINMAENILKYKDLSDKSNQLKDLSLIVSDTCSRDMDNPTKEFWVTDDKDDKDIVWCHPTISLANTNRFITSKPNLQGKNPDAKACIKAPKGYKILSLDISAQDVYPLIYGVMSDVKLKEMAQDLDPYMAFLRRLGYPETQENKKICKVPILSIMNGKSKANILSVATDKDSYEMILKVYNFIINDKGYCKVLADCNREADNELYSLDKCAYRTGLFGSKIKITEGLMDKYGNKNKNSLVRKKINGKFQISSAEVLSFSYMCCIYDILHGKIPNITIKECCPLFTIHDECVLLCKESKLDYCSEIIKWYFLPKVEGWSRMMGKITIGDNYVHK